MSERTQKRLSSMGAAALVGRLFLRVMLGRRLFWGLMLAACLPVGLALFLRLSKGNCGCGDFADLLAHLVLQFFGLGLPLLLAVAAIRDDREDKTLIYLWTRPVSRWALVFGKVMAAALVGCGLMLASAAAAGGVLLLGCGQGAEHAGIVMGRGLLAVGLAGLVYTPLFAMVAAIFRKPMVPAIILAFGWEVVVANLPGGFPRVTLMYYLKSFLGLGPDAKGMLSMFVESLNPAPTLLALLVLSAASLVFTLVTLGLATRRELN